MSAMLLTALLIAYASAAWVEISQQHYRKPLRTYHFTTKANLEHTTKPWHNHSVTEYKWNKDFNKHGVETSRNPLQDYEPENFNYGPTKASAEATLKGIVERVPNVGNVRKVQLNSSPVKSPNIQWKSDRDKNPYSIDEDNTKRVKHLKTTDKQSYDYRISIINMEFPNTTARKPYITKDKDGIIVTSGPVENENELYNITAMSSPKYDNVFVTEDGSRENFNHNRKTEGVHPKENVVTAKITETMKQTYKNQRNEFEIDTKHQQDRPISENGDNEARKGDRETEDEITDNSDLQEELKIQANQTSNVATMENLMKFMMVVTDTISKNSRRSFNGKMQYLQELKNNILANIEDRIEVTWPDDSAPGGRARRRSRSARGHVEFPSSESSLMTISFLTFAVFLIKLVLQVIQTYKNKTMMVAPLVVAAAGRAAFAHRQRN